MTMKLLRHPVSVSVGVEEAFEGVFHDASHALWYDDHGDRGVGRSFLASGTPVNLSRDTWRSDLRDARGACASVECEGLPLGIFFVLPYELGADTLGLSSLAGAATALPRAMAVDRGIEFDHHTGAVVVCAVGEDWSGELGQWRDRVIAVLNQLAPLAPPKLPQGLPVEWRDSTERYHEMIGLAQGAIAAGDAYQVCLTTSLSIRGSVDPVALHRHLREVNPTHHQALIRFPDLTLVSATPETFLEVGADRVVVTRPIKGTRPRGATAEEDAALIVELRESDKERAENLMIVDLMRNDLSPVAQVGSISVPELLVVETYASVHQLVSTVQATLRPDADVVDVIESTFPAGSMTGAPKRRAVELLAQWEGQPRGYYSGVFGVWRGDGSATIAMTIRTAVVTPEGLTLGVGGGITALSDPAFEVAEVGVKALPFLRALGHNQVQYS